MENFLELYTKIDVNLFLAIYLIITFLYVASRTTIKEKYIKYSYLNNILLSIELFVQVFIFGVIQYKGKIYGSQLENVYSAYCIISTILLLCFSKFIYYFVSKKEKISFLVNVIFSIPLIISILLVFLNAQFHFLFSFKELTLTFGDYYYLYSICSSLYFLAALISLLKYKKFLGLQEFLVILLALSVTLFFELSNITINYSVSYLTFLAICSICMLVLFKEKLMTLDFLTKAYNRNYFDGYLANIIKKQTTEFTLAFIDIDNFKNINDEFGYREGDLALANFVSTIKRVISKEDKIIRYGGDEFILFFPTNDSNDISKKLNTIYHSIEKYNIYSTKPYKLKYSSSFEIFDKDKYSTSSQIIHVVDRKMYKIKLDKKKEKKNDDSNNLEIKTLLR